MSRTTLFVRCLVPAALVIFVLLAHAVEADAASGDAAAATTQTGEGNQSPEGNQAPEASQAPEGNQAPAGSQTQEATETQEANESAFDLSPEVNAALLPLFKSIADANVSRATVELSAESSMKGKVIERQSSTYHVASEAPGNYTIYLKEPDQRTRVYCDGETMVAALAPEAYLRLPSPISSQDAVTDLPIPLGPYPEPILALTIAGVDPAVSFVGGMKKLEIVDQEPFGDDVPATHLMGVQSDDVTWDLWLATEGDHRPLRLVVDLTPMLRTSGQVQIPEGYAYQLRFDFLSWRVTGEVDQSLFRYTPPKDAKEYASLEEYYRTLAGVMGEHPLVGKKSPEFTATDLDGDEISSETFGGKVVVLDFWATWCAPCVASLPVMERVTDEYTDKDVLFFAFNIGETAEKVREFLEEKELDIGVILDPTSEVASAFAADAIPLTLVLGKDGVIESAHVGFVGEEALEQRLRDELDVLSIGGKIASADGGGESGESTTATDGDSGDSGEEEASDDGGQSEASKS